MTDTAVADTSADADVDAAAKAAADTAAADAAESAKAAADAKAATDAKAAADAAKAADTTAADWRAGIEDAKVREFADRFASPKDIAKAAFDQRQKLSTAVSIPGKDASDEDRAAFYKKLGVPETAEAYEVKLPDDLPEGLEIDDAAKARVEALKAKMHAVNASPEAVQAATDAYFEVLSGVFTDRQAAFQKFQDDSKELLAKEWGADFDRNMTFAKRAMKEFGDEDIIKIMASAEVDGMLLGDTPAMVKMWANLGRRMGSDSLHFGMTETEITDAQGRIDTIMAWMHGTPEEQMKYKSDAVQAELNSLYNKTTGGGSIVGQGRSL